MIYMNFTNNHGESDSFKDEVDLIKEVIFQLCIGEIPFTSSTKPITLDYQNREVILLSKGETVGSIPFEIIYFDIKRKQLEVKDYAEAILKIIEEEIGKLAFGDVVIL
ncbi:hypothetical protein SAMN02745217_00798 [Anaerocolumna xylanovorans DSM 12503]|uniref:Uncharacterized protein n=2 Tax=Anaerocolumna TaxID=1843210 RepID=A0A1M7Y0A6_9FIRM|nr:hypothetical protein SAMN02745217_00798 [Anaerocolumna xylanovorans DSM 12503]